MCEALPGLGVRGALVSALHLILGISKNIKPKQALHKLYDFTKRGTDIVNQRISFYSCKRKSQKWNCPFFLSFEKRSGNGLTNDIVKKIKFVLGEQDFSVNETTFLTPFPPDSAKPRRCESSIAEIRSSVMQKRKDKLTKRNGQCQSCGKTVGKRHRFQFCVNCP